jgi:hypothetical protein
MADSNYTLSLHGKHPQVSLEQGPLEDQTESSVQCSICQTLTPMNELLLIPERGQLCPACTIATRSALDGL